MSLRIQQFSWVQKKAASSSASSERDSSCCATWMHALFRTTEKLITWMKDRIINYREINCIS
jgi:hypothetical protein